MQNDVTMHQIRLFLKVAETGSFSKTAISSGLPQPSISRAIARIESIAGEVKLFERSSRGVVLTAAGETFRQHARQALHHHNLALAEVQSTTGVLHGEARLATPESVANILFLPLITQFHAMHPQARVRVMTSSSFSIPSLIDNDVVDFGIIADTHALPALPLEALCREDLYLIGRSDAAPLQQQSIALTEVAELPLILNAMPGGLRSLIDDAFAGLKLKPKAKIEIDSNEPMLELVLAGEGFSILPFAAIAGKERFEKLSAVKIVNPEISRRMLLATAGNRPFPAVCREATKLLRKLMQENAEKARWQ